MTRKEVSEAASVGLTTLYKFESGNMTDISFSTLLRLLKAIGLVENWDMLLPELPESPYLYDNNERKMQRVRKRKSEWHFKIRPARFCKTEWHQECHRYHKSSCRGYRQIQRIRRPLRYIPAVAQYHPKDVERQSGSFRLHGPQWRNRSNYRQVRANNHWFFHYSKFKRSLPSLCNNKRSTS